MDEKESLSQHVVKRGQCSGRHSAWESNGSGEAWNHRFLDRCAGTAETKKEKANATVARTGAACLAA